MCFSSATASSPISPDRPGGAKRRDGDQRRLSHPWGGRYAPPFPQSVLHGRRHVHSESKPSPTASKSCANRGSTTARKTMVYLVDLAGLTAGGILICLSPFQRQACRRTDIERRSGRRALRPMELRSRLGLDHHLLRRRPPSRRRPDGILWTVHGSWPTWPWIIGSRTDLPPCRAGSRSRTAFCSWGSGDHPAALFAWQDHDPWSSCIRSTSS